MAPTKASQGVREAWVAEQSRLAKLCVDTDDLDWSLQGESIHGLRHVAGVDVSFFPYGTHAVAAVVIVSYPDMEVLYERCATFQLKVPYMPGFLAFREVPALKAMLQKVPSKWRPQVVLVDGNGVFHPRMCGSATHLGIVVGMPAIGVAKDVLQVGDVNVSTAQKLGEKLQKAGEWTPLFANRSDEHPLAALLRPCENKKTVVVSVGHKISLNTAIHLTALLCKSGVPEPIRQADLRSRAAVKAWFEWTPLMKLKMPAQEGAGDLLQIALPEREALRNSTIHNVSSEHDSKTWQTLSKKDSGRTSKSKLVWRVKVSPKQVLPDEESHSTNLDSSIVSISEGDWGLCWFFQQYLGGLCVLRA